MHASLLFLYYLLFGFFHKICRSQIRAIDRSLDKDTKFDTVEFTQVSGDLSSPSMG